MGFFFEDVAAVNVDFGEGDGGFGGESGVAQGGEIV